eukprot:gene5147-10287_t
MSVLTSLPIGTKKGTSILWDVDGTLCDSYMLGFTSTQNVLQKNGYPLISESDYHLGTKLTTPRRLAWHATGNPDNELGISLGQQFDDLYVGLVSVETAPLYDGIIDILQELSKDEHVSIGALSNACGSYVRAVLASNKINQYFSVQYGADEVPAAKPSSLGLLKCCEELHVSPTAAIYIGDSPSDGEAARSAGMYGIGVTWGSHPVETVKPAFDKTVHSVKELQEEINHWLSEQSFYLGTEERRPRRKSVSWREDVVNNEGMGKLRTDDEFWTK